MAHETYDVLFLCTGNSARSILAEAILDHLGKGRFRAWSAGSRPRGSVHPFAVDLLRAHRFPTEGLRSKSWDEFAANGAKPMDFVFTVCDRAGQESCPFWPGTPVTAHWGVADPAAVEGTEAEQRAAFVAAMAALSSRIRRFVALPLESLDRRTLREQLDAIGRG